MEIKCQLDAADDFYCRSYCLLNMFRAPLCPSSGARDYYTGGCCLWYLVLWFSSCRYGVELRLICNKNHLLHLVDILFPHINDDAGSKSHKTFCILVLWCFTFKTKKEPKETETHILPKTHHTKLLHLPE